MASVATIEPARRLLQAVCYPGHAVLLRRRRVVLSTGEPIVLAGLAQIAQERSGDLASTLAWVDGTVACIRRNGEHTLIVVVPRTMDTTRVHAKMQRAIALFARRKVSPPWTPPRGRGSTGGSGAPAEVFAQRVRPRPS